MLAIDKATNNTSIVFSLNWRGWKLLFTGDAEVRSWRTMDREGVLEPVHFLKVSHHGSHNGTPDGPIIEKVLPKVSPDGWERFAVISSYPGAYSGIPHQATNEELEKRCDALLTTTDSDELYLDVEFPG
jgi:beta-lactamase superfamily II metal-dependent hydrolase